MSETTSPAHVLLPPMPETPMTEKEQRAYDEALRRIEKCGPSGKSLDLGSLGLTKLPPEIGQLQALKKLSVQRNHLSTLPPEIGRLHALTHLYVFMNNLSRLPPEIGQLQALKELHLQENHLSTLPPEIGQLHALKKLSIQRNHLSTLPMEIGQLHALTHLYLFLNQLSTLPAEIGQLRALRLLSLSDNTLSTLPPEIAQLQAVRELYLAGNDLSMLPREVGQLQALTLLNLSDNRLSNLPPEIGQLQALKELFLSENQLRTLPPEIGELESLMELYLHNNSGLGLPAEVLGPRWDDVHTRNAKPKPPKEILEYHFSTVGGAGRALREVKLILVGRGEVGKSSMADVLRAKKFVKNRKRTDGISILPWDAKLVDGPATLLLWDFGGQEIMHGTHQFFLTHRSLYVVMVDGRHDRGKQDAEYWLKLVRAFGGESGVFVVMNRQKAHPFDLDRQYLSEKYGVPLDHFFRTDCESPKDIKRLREAILEEARRMLEQEERFPSACWDVKTRLAEMKMHREDYLSEQRYTEICCEHGVRDTEEQRKLLRRLADLGTVVSFPDDLKLAELTVLNPEWVTDGIYRVVTNEGLREEKHGHLKRAALRTLLPEKRWPERKHLQYLLDLMEKFELCFPVDDESNDKVLVPELLPDVTPQLPGWKAEQCVVFVYRYTVLPHGVLPRFITRTHMLSRGQERWRTGVVLADDGAHALIRADYDANEVRIWVRGQFADSRRALLKVVRSHFDHIHSRIKDLNPTELVAVPGHPDVLVPYQDVVNDERDRKFTFRVTIKGKRLDWNLREILNGVETLEERRKKRPRELRGMVERAVFVEPGGHYHEHGETMNQEDHSIHIGGNAQGNAFGDSSAVMNQNSFNQGIQSEELKKLFETLIQQLAPVRGEMKGKDIQVLDQHLQVLQTEAAKPEEERDTGALSVSGKGLIDAANTVKDIAGPVIATAGMILKFLGVPLP